MGKTGKLAFMGIAILIVLLAIAFVGVEAFDQEVAGGQPDRAPQADSLVVAGTGLPSTPETTSSAPGLSSHRIAASIPLTPGIGLEPRAIAADPRSPLVY
ncbi:MAG: hypothetical protein ACP5OO_13450, partial [Chloroflexia bacterium]